MSDMDMVFKKYYYEVKSHDWVQNGESGTNYWVYYKDILLNDGDRRAVFDDLQVAKKFVIDRREKDEQFYAEKNYLKAEAKYRNSKSK